MENFLLCWWTWMYYYILWSFAFTRWTNSFASPPRHKCLSLVATTSHQNRPMIYSFYLTIIQVCFFFSCCLKNEIIIIRKRRLCRSFVNQRNDYDDVGFMDYCVTYICRSWTYCLNVRSLYEFYDWSFILRGRAYRHLLDVLGSMGE